MLMIAGEGVSLLAFIYPALTLPILAIVGGVVFYAAFRSPELGIYVLFGELFVGSRGHLLAYQLGSVSLSVRQVIFTVVILAALARFGKNKNVPLKGLFADLPSAYWFLLATVVWGVVNGIRFGNGFANLYADGSGYLYLAILPLVIGAIRSRRTAENLFRILGAAVVVIAGQTLILYLWFMYGISGVPTLYHWVIGQNLGEITGAVGTAPRIFLASQFYALVGLFIYAFAERKNWLVISSAILSLILGLSRSFWLGGVAGIIFGAAAVLLFRFPLWKHFKTWLVVVLIVVLEVGGLLGLSYLGGGKFSTSVSSRARSPGQEAAGVARLLLLPELLEGIREYPALGQGFGKVLTYKSYLPDRVAVANPEGKITSYRFEWGYLDIMLKVGFLGLLVYLFFIAHIFKQGWSNLQFAIYNFQTLGILSGLVALLILNLTTPYLNHPLGIGYLILALASFKVTDKTQSAI